MADRSEDDYTPLQAELFEVWEGLATMRGVALTHSTPHPDHGHLTDLGKLLQRDISSIMDKIGTLEARAEAAEQRCIELEAALQEARKLILDARMAITRDLRQYVMTKAQADAVQRADAFEKQARRLLGGE